MKKYDVVLLTDARYVAPINPGEYEQNILNEDKLLSAALAEKGLKVYRTKWDDPDIDWSETKSVIFRTTWDYFHRFKEFLEWLHSLNKKTILINPMELLLWNLDKHYLDDLQKKGIAIPPTVFIEKGDLRALQSIVEEAGWDEIILKPAVGGAARHTYRIAKTELDSYENIFRKHIIEESFLIQQFQESVLVNGEVSLMVMDGRFTHAVLKIAKQGDFRVQDDFGGTVYPYTPSKKEIAFAEQVVAAAPMLPLYARVDIIWGNNDEAYVSELEIVEPELWFRFYPKATKIFAKSIFEYLQKQTVIDS
ncbi:MAG: hypothetical protein KA954_03295 [Chitinophagales bacterium]|nr:hypothetical protein [Chitinophagales bacterium]MBP8752897.1 hypothetical protein [Chitinophagales bacterium]MBP9188765.1 hypothetical protein [Chitinophagales bacterium]MBP9704392.1 hypothetical protein [Chitinophagales bacterium]